MAAALTYEKIVEAVRDKFSDTDVSDVKGTLAFQFNVEGLSLIHISEPTRPY